MKTITMVHPHLRRSLWFMPAACSFITGLMLLLAGCQKQELAAPGSSTMAQAVQGKGWQSPETVMRWNMAMQQSFTLPVGIGSPPPVMSRAFAMYQVVMHDALNAVVPRYATYAYQGPTDRWADADAAVSQAAWEMVNALKFPWQSLASFQELHSSIMASIPDGEGKTRGQQLGKAVAQALLNKRAADQPYIAITGFVPTPANGTTPGQYRYLPPLNYALAGFHLQQTWVIPSASHFRPGSIYGVQQVADAVKTAAYAADFEEVKNYGRLGTSLRTPDQSQMGVFWAENSSRGWNAVAREVIANRPAKSLDAWKTARLFALVHIAVADGYISNFDSKTYFNFWRPISAIRLADTDGNEATTGEATWSPVLATPAVGEFCSAHAQTGAAAGAVLLALFDKDDMELNMTSGYLPGIVRQYTSLRAAIRDNSLSRIYIGYHFRHAIEVGEALGYELGYYVAAHALPER